MRYIFVFLIFFSGCAPFVTNIQPNDKGGYVVTQTGKMPRTSTVELSDDIKKQKLKLSFDNKFKLLPTINASMFNFGAAVSRDN